MSNRIKRNKGKKETESVLTTCCHFLRQVLDYIVCLYMLLIIGVMPFYFQKGYTHIGTDKHTFFRYCSLNIGKLLLPVFVLFCLCSLIRFVTEYREDKKKQKIHRNYLGDLLKAWIKTFNVIDIFALLYGIVLIISYVCSDYKEMALWGASGWYMGLIPQLSLLASYFCISRLWKKRDWMFYLLLLVSAVVFALGILNRFGIYPMDMKIENPQFISTIGNINWYCGYMVSVFFGGFFLLWKSRNIANDKRKGKKDQWIRILLMVYVAIGFATLVTQGSLSGFLALGAVLVVLFCLSARDGNCMEMFWQGILILSVVCLLIIGVRVIGEDTLTYQDRVIDLFTKSILPFGIFMVSFFLLMILTVLKKKNGYPAGVFRVIAWIVGLGTVIGTVSIVAMITINTLYPGSIGALSQYDFFTFSSNWGSLRGATWRVGALCVENQSLLQRFVGVGPDCMEAFIGDLSNEQIQEILRTYFSGLRLTNAHCEWFTILIDTGILGLISYAGMIISAMICFLGQKKGNTLIAGACGVCVLAYTVNNMVSFQQSMSVATIYVILGIGRAYCDRLHLGQNSDKII